MVAGKQRDVRHAVVAQQLYRIACRRARAIRDADYADRRPRGADHHQRAPVRS